MKINVIPNKRFMTALFVVAIAAVSLETARGVALPQPGQAEVATAKITEAREALKKGETDRAITLLNEVIAADPNNAEAYHFRGVAHAGKENFPAAAADLEKAIELNPGDAQSHYFAGMVYGRLNQTDKMVDHYEAFLRLSPESPEAAKVQSLLRSVR